MSLFGVVAFYARQDKSDGGGDDDDGGGGKHFMLRPRGPHLSRATGSRAELQKGLGLRV